MGRSRPPIRLRKVPWHTIRQVYRSVRQQFFTVPEPTTPALVVDVGPTRVEDAFGQRSFAPNWEFSYNYRGEDINLARVERVPHKPHGVAWWQTHLRGWEQEDGTLRLRAHWEPEPTEHPIPHLSETGFSWPMGTEVIRKEAREAGLDAEYHERLAPP